LNLLLPIPPHAALLSPSSCGVCPSVRGLKCNALHQLLQLQTSFYFGNPSPPAQCTLFSFHPSFKPLPPRSRNAATALGYFTLQMHEPFTNILRVFPSLGVSFSDLLTAPEFSRKLPTDFYYRRAFATLPEPPYLYVPLYDNVFCSPPQLENGPKSELTVGHLPFPHLPFSL